MTIEMSFTPEIIALINQERYRRPLPIVQQHMEALWLKSHGLPHYRRAKATVDDVTSRYHWEQHTS